ncbi:MAG: tRNA pseudouridine(55) synthase TruB [Planctomycetota bacterium]
MHDANPEGARGAAEAGPSCGSVPPACLRMWLWRVPGLFIVRKPAGISSFGVIRLARRELGLRKIGHAGTLDPLAEGVLVLGVGKATKLLTGLEGADKSYRATLRLGVRTDTYDSTGKVVEERDPSGVTEEALSDALSRFRGEIRQVPPMFSAIKKDGETLYKLARRGVEVEREPRRVIISRLELVEFSPPCATLDIDCSKGTYVRSLVEDVGLALGVGANMTALVRTRVGPFGIEMARELGSLLTASG